MKDKYLTYRLYEWFCKRCKQTVMLDDSKKPRCGCDWRNSTVAYPLADGTLELAHAASPWEPIEVDYKL